MIGTDWVGVARELALRAERKTSGRIYSSLSRWKVGGFVIEAVEYGSSRSELTISLSCWRTAPITGVVSTLSWVADVGEVVVVITVES